MIHIEIVDRRHYSLSRLLACCLLRSLPVTLCRAQFSLLECALSALQNISVKFLVFFFSGARDS